MPGQQGVLRKKDPAHEYWEKRGQGTWNISRGIREAFWGVKGYNMSHFVVPKSKAIAEVRRDPARANWDKELKRMRVKYPHLSFLIDQWRLQNRAQALGGNPLPVKAGRIMLEGLERMGRATTLTGKLGGHWYAQIYSLGNEGFRGGASYFMHALAIPWQWPGIATRHFFSKYFNIPENFHPIRIAGRMAGRKVITWKRGRKYKAKNRGNK
ncbi:hypothetical protein [Spirosoma linguale]